MKYSMVVREDIERRLAFLKNGEALVGLLFPTGRAIRSQGGLSKAKSSVVLVCSEFSAFYAGLYGVSEFLVPSRLYPGPSSA